MNSKEAKSSSELKQEVLQELRQVNNDINRIQGRLTPGQIIDDALLRGGSNPRAVFDHLKENPIGTAFLGLGTLLLMEDDSHVTYESQLKTQGAVVAGKTRNQAMIARAKINQANQKLHGVTDKVQSKVNEVSNRVQGSFDRTKDKVTGIKDKISHRRDAKIAFTGEQDLGDGGEMGHTSIDELKSNLGEFQTSIGEAREEISEKVVSMKDTVRELDPMTFMAIGAGLGALTGIALPVSEKEQTLIDDNLGNKLSGIGSEFQDAINQSVKVLKDEFIGKFTDFDVNLFGKKSSVNETFRSEGH